MSSKLFKLINPRFRLKFKKLKTKNSNLKTDLKLFSSEKTSNSDWTKKMMKNKNSVIGGVFVFAFDEIKL